MLDISDTLDKNCDIQFVDTHKYRAYNLVRRFFPDNPYIGIDLQAMVEAGIHQEQVQMALNEYLISFGVIFTDNIFNVDSKGVIHINYKTEGTLINRLNLGGNHVL